MPNLLNVAISPCLTLPLLSDDWHVPYVVLKCISEGGNKSACRRFTMMTKTTNILYKVTLNFIRSTQIDLPYFIWFVSPFAVFIIIIIICICILLLLLVLHLLWLFTFGFVSCLLCKLFPLPVHDVVWCDDNGRIFFKQGVSLFTMDTCYGAAKQHKIHLQFVFEHVTMLTKGLTPFHFAQCNTWP